MPPESEIVRVQDDLSRRMAALGLREEDVEESFVRSSGPGGQNVNKVATCVQLVHRPTGVRVRCQSSRHQAANRRRARELLVARLEARRDALRSAARSAAEARRRASRPRPPALRRRLLESKTRRGRTKQLRRPPGVD